MRARELHEIGRIVATPGTVGGEPRLDGSRLPTGMLYAMVEQDGMTVEEIIAMYPHLHRCDVLAAVAFERGRRFRKSKKWRVME